MHKVLVDLRVDEHGLRRLRALPEVEVVVLDTPEEEQARPMQRLVDGDLQPFEPRDFEGAVHVRKLDIDGPRRT